VDARELKVGKRKGYSESSSSHGPCWSQRAGIALTPSSIAVAVVVTEEVMCPKSSPPASPLPLRAAAFVLLEKVVLVEALSDLAMMAPLDPELAPPRPLIPLVRQEMAFARFNAIEWVLRSLLKLPPFV
jgi:hypothetical protein